MMSRYKLRKIGLRDRFKLPPHKKIDHGKSGVG